MANEFTSPTGRLVWGDPYTPRPKTETNGNPKFKHGTTEPMVSTDVGVAFAKNDPQTATFLATLRAADKAAYPQYHDAVGNLIPGAMFANKITDGDSQAPNRKGKRPCDREGYPGHWVVSFSSAFAPTCYEWNGSGWVQTAAGKIRAGDYVQIGGNTTANNSADSPGMYRNLNMVALIGHGVPIVNGPSADAVFGGSAPVLPAGATAQPQAAAPLPVGNAPVAGAPVPTSVPVTASNGSAAPYSGFMDIPAPTSIPAPTGPTMTALANGATREQFHAKGWTDEAMIAAGYMTA